MSVWRRGLRRDDARDARDGDARDGDAGDGDAGDGMGTVSYFSCAKLSCLGEGVGGRDKRGKRY